jgi:nitrite reductase/ring-hydroxylating ferredoxin subunit
MTDTPEAWETTGIDPRSATFPATAVVAGLPIWVFRVNDGFRGVQELCPHDQRSLENARIVGNATMVRCAFHNYTFELTNGSGVNCPGFRIAVYEIKEEDGTLLARVSNST